MFKTLMCERCFSELEVNKHVSYINGIEVLSLFTYNEKLKTMLYHLKGLNDLCLARVFLERHRLFLKLRYFSYIVLPAPSSVESDTERGFNHVIEIFKCLNLETLPIIRKKTNFKQSDLTYIERQKVNEKLVIINGDKLKNKKVLIVDDLKTSGATLKAMITLVKPFNPKKLKVLTIASTKLNT